MDVMQERQSDLPIGTAVAEACRQLAEIIGLKPCAVLEVSQSGDGWRVVVEVLERKAVPDSMDLLAGYEVHVDAAGHMTDFARLRLRRRADNAPTAQ